MLGDGFDRAELGNIWRPEQDGMLRPIIDETTRDRLVFNGKFTRGEVLAVREGAVPRGKNFLAVGITMQFGPTQSMTEGFAGLGIEIARGNDTKDLLVRVGVREGGPFLKIEDGREAPGETRPPVTLTIDGFDARARHQLELRVVPRGAEEKQLTLLVSWNGVVVHQHELKQLSGSTTQELKTVLFAEGNRNNAIDVAFDDFRLERKKDR
jgi:hypothetical protein